jgi:Leucine-rich repeat (LRR) protein
VLDLSKNTLNSIDEKAFEPISHSLIQLKLSANRLFEMDVNALSRAFVPLNMLSTLFLNHNELTALPNLSAYKNLSEVNLANNQLKSIYDEATRERLLPDSIKSLHLENNHIKHINADTFAGLNKLKYLNLENNRVESIDDQSFAHLTHLQTLNLGKNYLKQIPSSNLITLVNLERIDLSAQNLMLKEIEDYAFDRTSNTNTIRKIDLSKNQIGTYFIHTLKYSDNNGKTFRE